jgi:8-oxo-dGTP diphosphatase
VKLRTRGGLSEEGYEAEPGKAHRYLARLLERGEPSLLCTHGPVLPALLDDLAARLDLDAAGSVEVVEEFAQARDEKLLKGEALVCHVVGTGDAARVVAVERHLP